MPAELDHVFICVSPGGEEAATLTAFGLIEGTPNTHPGQGTACRRFFFANAYLELLWVCDPAEARSAISRPMYLAERWEGRGAGACPFGLGFRPSAGGDVGPPFPTWEYRPSYLPSDMSLQIASNAALLAEPLLFYLSSGRRPDCQSTDRRQIMQQSAGLRELTRIDLFTPHAGPLSPALAAVTQTSLVHIRPGDEYLLELGFDGETRGQSADFRPELPLVICC